MKRFNNNIISKYNFKESTQRNEKNIRFGTETERNLFLKLIDRYLVFTNTQYK